MQVDHSRNEHLALNTSRDALLHEIVQHLDVLVEKHVHRENVWYRWRLSHNACFLVEKLNALEHLHELLLRESVESELIAELTQDVLKLGRHRKSEVPNVFGSNIVQHLSEEER